MIDEGSLRGLIAVVSLTTFLGICWWAYRPQSRARFERDALLVFEEGERFEVPRGHATEGARATGGEHGEGGASA